MYNETVKLNYIASIEMQSVKDAIKSLFNKIGDKIEAPQDKEIASMSREVVIDGLERSGYQSVSTMRTEISHLTDYFDWYSKNVQVVDENIKTIIPSDISLVTSIRENLFGSVDEIGLSLISFPPDEGYYHAPICCLMWLGLEVDEILNLKNEDVFLIGADMFVRTPSKIIQVESKYVYDTLLEYSKSIYGVRTHYGDREVYADDIGYFIKSFLSKNSTRLGKRIKPINVRRKLAASNAQLNMGVKRVTETSVLTSGRLYRVREEERKNGSISMATFINEFKTTKDRPIRDAMSLYDFYKMAYGD